LRIVAKPWVCIEGKVRAIDGNVILEQEECFYCSLVPVEQTTWGSIKGLYNN